MSRSAGAGSPVWFRCANERGGRRGDHEIKLTGRTRPYHRKRHSAMGSRSTDTAREYECSCGHVGWSNHLDLERMENADEQSE